MTTCACGCGNPVTIARSGRPNVYLRGHHHRGVPKSAEQRRLISLARLGQPGPWRGKKIPAAARAKMSEAAKARRLSPQHRGNIAASMRGKPHPSIHHNQSIETRLKKSRAQRGERGSNWQGGRSSVNERARASFLFGEWRLAVFRRDGFTCQHCGARHCKGARPELHAHHIKPFATHPQLRFEISNGLTLCKKCHDIVHGRTHG